MTRQVLVVDDELYIRNILDFSLNSEGFEVISAADGEESLKKAIDLIPDLIVLDVMMPKIDGFEVCRAIKAKAETKHIPVILLTALGEGARTYIIGEFRTLGSDLIVIFRGHTETRGGPPIGGTPNDLTLDDAVTRVPPFTFGYRHTGELRYIDSSGDIHEDIAFSRLVQTAKDVQHGRLA